MWEKHLANREIGFYTGRSAFDPDRLSLLMLHGAGGRGEGYLPQLTGLDSVANVAALDLPGHKDTPGPAMTSIDDYAAWLADFLDAGPVRPVLLGHSMGGAISQALALSRPDLVKGIVLVGTGSRLPVNPAVIEGVRQNFQQAIELIVKWAYAPGADPVLLKQGVEHLLENDPEVVAGDFIACDNFDFSGRLAEIDLPAMVMVGESDKMAPLKASQFLAENIPGARLEVIQLAGHMPNVEQFQEFNRLVTEFMAGL